jgi:hypothetical protein
VVNSRADSGGGRFLAAAMWVGYRAIGVPPVDRALGGHGSDVAILVVLTLIGVFGIRANLVGRKS